METAHYFGAIPSKKDVRDYRLKTSEVATCAAAFPEEFELSMPEVKNQGSVGSCVANSLAVIVEYYSRSTGDESRPFSTGFIYGNRRDMNHEGPGLFTRQAIANTCKYGDVVNSLFPYSMEVPEIIDRFENNIANLKEEAYPNRFSSYYACPSETEIKTALMKKNPVAFSIPWYKELYVNRDNILTSLGDSQTLTAYHCMVIYGWNKYGWKIQNSWGQYWGNKGRAILPYSYPIREAFGIVDEISENHKRELLEELKRENETLKNKIKENNINYQIQIDKLAEILNKNTVEKNQLLKEIETLNKLDTDAKDQIIECKKIIERQKKIISEFESQIIDLTRTVDEITKEKKEFLMQLEQSNQQIQELEAELTEIKKPYSFKFGKIIAKLINAWYRILDAFKAMFKKKK